MTESPLHEYFGALHSNSSNYKKTQPLLAPVVRAINSKVCHVVVIFVLNNGTVRRNTEQ